MATVIKRKSHPSVCWNSAHLVNLLFDGGGNDCCSHKREASWWKMREKDEQMCYFVLCYLIRLTLWVKTIGIIQNSVCNFATTPHAKIHSEKRLGKWYFNEVVICELSNAVLAMGSSTISHGISATIKPSDNSFHQGATLGSTNWRSGGVSGEETQRDSGFVD